MKLVKRIFVDGIFDLFHEGHKNLIKNAIAKAKEKNPDCAIEVMVGICDEGVASYKRKTIMTLEERNNAVHAFMQEFVKTQDDLSYKVILNSPIVHSKEFVEEHRIQVIFHGNDFNEEKIEKYYGAIKSICDFETVPYTPGVSTTQLIVGLWRNRFFAHSQIDTGVPTDELKERIQNRSLDDLGITAKQYLTLSR